MSGPCELRPEVTAYSFFPILALVFFLLSSAPTFVFAAVPGAPTIGPTSAGSGKVTVNFSPPASDGGSPILEYTVTSSPDGLTAVGSSSPLTVTGLTNGRVYTFTVSARNDDGIGPSSGASFNTTPRLFAPTSGTINNLVVFVRFSDQPEFNQPLSYYDAIFNSAGNSLKNFYLENSYGVLTVNSTFYPLPDSGAVISYQDPHPVSYYQGSGPADRETVLVTNALNSVDADIAASGLNPDSDGDGYIDHITFEVYSSDLHPQPVAFNSRATYDTSGGVAINGLKVGSYTWVTAVQDSSYPDYSFASVEIHEMGHNFGYPDLRNNFNSRDPVGNWDVMANAFGVVHSGAYEKYKFTHWIADIPEITSYGDYTLNDIRQATNNSWKIRLPNTNEFLVLEYRKAAGPFESRLPGSGLCITRVNEAAGIWGNMNGPPFFLYYFRPGGTVSNDGGAGGLFQCLNAESGQTQFNDYSNPACFLSDGRPCGISIYNIGTTEGNSISFSVGDPAATVVTHAISGYVYNGGSRVSGATVTLSGDAAGAVTTDSLGRYLFTVNEGGTYTINPAKAYMTFSPAGKTFSHVTTDQVQNFSATNITNTISGTMTSGGTALSGIHIYCDCAGMTTTDAAGRYSFTVNSGSTCSIWSTETGYMFTPNSKTFADITADTVQDFVTRTVDVNLTGTITYNGSPLSGVNVSCPGAKTATPVVTNSSGAYSFTVTVGGGSSYTVTPVSGIYRFSPVNKAYVGIVGSQSQIFTAALAQHALIITMTGSGTVLADNNPLPWNNGTSDTSYNDGASVTLTATADQCSSFRGWGGDYQSYNADASFLMDRDWHISATFSLNLPAYDETEQKDYPTLSAISQAASDGDRLEFQAVDFDEALLIERSGLTVTGGVDCDYRGQDAATTLRELVIDAGSAVVGGIIIQ